MVDTNVKGLMYVTRAVLPGMVARDTGHVVNIGSTAASYPYPSGNVYGATKAFVRQLSPEDVADTVFWAATRSARVNINVIELMPVSQAFGPLVVHRGDRGDR